MKKNNHEIGERLRNARLNAKLSQKETSERIGMSMMTLRRYEMGLNSLPTYYIHKLADLFGVDANWLLTGDNKNTDEFTPSEKILINHYRELDDEMQQYALDLLKGLVRFHHKYNR